MPSRRAVSTLGVKPMMGAHIPYLDINQALSPWVVKQATAVTLISLASAFAARAIEAASLCSETRYDLLLAPFQEMVLGFMDDPVHHRDRFHRIFSGCRFGAKHDGVCAIEDCIGDRPILQPVSATGC